MTGQYPDNWDEIAKEVKDRAGWQCEHCNAKNDVRSGRVLTVHHLDGNKSNCADDNLAALCQRCHLHWQSRFVVGQGIMPFARPAWLEQRGLG